jgi:hypothetical protein
MDYALEERIGNPDLFTGRKAELDYFLKWISDIKERKSQSTAMLARRKGENRPPGTVVQYHLLQKRWGNSFLL